MVPNGDMGDGEVTRDGTRLAVTIRLRREHEDQLLRGLGDVETGSAGLPAVRRASMTNPDPKFGDPTWAPDGAGIAFESSKGIEVSRFTQFGPGACEAPNDVLLTADRHRARLGPRRPARGRLQRRPSPRRRRP